MITVTRLFQAMKPIDDLGGKAVACALSEVDTKTRYTQAMLARVRQGRLLRNKDSDEYAVNVEPLAASTDDDLIKTTLALRKIEILRDVSQQISPEYIPFPENATPEEEAGVLTAREEMLREVDVRRGAKAEELFASEESRLLGLSHDKLLAEAIRATISISESNAFSDAYLAWTILLGTFTPDGKRYFENEREVERLPRRVRDIILTAIAEVDNLDPLTLSGQSSMA